MTEVEGADVFPYSETEFIIISCMHSEGLADALPQELPKVFYQSISALLSATH